MKNIEATPTELAFIRSLADFDLTMFLSDLHDNGWIVARYTLVHQAQAKCGGEDLRAKIISHAEERRLAVKRFMERRRSA